MKNQVFVQNVPGDSGGFSDIPLKKFVVILDQPPDFVVPSVSDYSRLTLRKRLLMMENVVNLEMRS